MRTPVVLVCGQGDADGVAGTLMKAPGTAVVGHEFDGHVVRRWVSILRDGELSTTEVALELRKTSHEVKSQAARSRGGGKA